MSTFEKVFIIDAKGHLMGRLSATVAKLLLNGQKVVILRCEELNISGSHFRNKIKLHSFLRKRCLVNPKKGPFHFRAPSLIFKRTIRGMVPHKTHRGATALNRLQVFEGVPPAYATKKRMVVPQALRVLRLKPGRKYATLGRLASEIGWKYQEIVSTLEAKRKVKGAAFYERNLAQQALRTKAAANQEAKLAEINSGLATLGY
ncbi:60S ribosomal protein L16A [Dimargaris cristalligena]|uniref:60S ribosomal protein L16 n=1 Tax=Dimargaris cristalligena TaxID=215637 RepID=A0A4P9ZWF9_9FUNG|nr:60S ribosomal protein L16A [Dimargaris cristalligena]RKP37943.1 60S ribosomal protein L16 [Dimargaris cristalligena]|eukprot:RKP37943.1 60S ribosomal protein L16 [Dimargaris cristalligena]